MKLDMELAKLTSEQRKIMLEIIMQDSKEIKGMMKHEFVLMISSYLMIGFTISLFIRTFNSWLGFFNLLMVLFNIFNAKRTRKSYNESVDIIEKLNVIKNQLMEYMKENGIESR